MTQNDLDTNLTLNLFCPRSRCVTFKTMGDQKPQNQTFRFSDFFDDGITDSSSPKPCSDCGRVFMMNGLLDIHWQKVHAAPSLLSCLDCNVDFRRKMGESRFDTLQSFRSSWINIKEINKIQSSISQPLGDTFFVAKIMVTQFGTTEQNGYNQANIA